MLNWPSAMLQLSCSVCVNVSKNCRPFLPGHFLLLLFFLFAAHCKIHIYCLPLVWMFEFAIFIICFPVEHGLLHDGSTYLGYYILHSIIVVCSHCRHGLYHHSWCLCHCLGYCLHYNILLSCYFRFLFYLFRNYFCDTALFESAYFLLLMGSTSVCLTEAFTPDTI